MKHIEIIEFLKDKTNWTKNIVEKDLWSYTNITEIIKVGRQKYDWAIFRYDKNLKFYFAESYKHIPQDLVVDLLNIIKKNK